MASQIETELTGLLARVSPTERRKLARELAARLRQRNQARIAAQTEPDGTPFEARKPSKFRAKSGTIRRAMFSKLRTARWLKTSATTEAATVGFVSKVGRIAAVHQYGLRDRVRPGIDTTYPRRQLLGFAQQDVEEITDTVLEHLTK